MGRRETVLGEVTLAVCFLPARFRGQSLRRAVAPTFTRGLEHLTDLETRSEERAPAQAHLCLQSWGAARKGLVKQHL